MKPLILMTNDDGVFSPGLAAAVAAVQDLGELLIVAPRFQQTTMGRSFPHQEQTGSIERVRIQSAGKNFPAFGVVGSPAQAVAHGILELADRLPDLCISGINYGANLGLSLTCSGTLGAAFEADSQGVPSIAISRQTPLHWQRTSDYPEADWSAAQQCLATVVKHVIAGQFPRQASILNINVPDQPVQPLDIRWTRQSRFNDSNFVKPGPRDRMKGFCLETIQNQAYASLPRDSDAYALYMDKAVSITPLTWNMTAGMTTDMDLESGCY
ncbi:MAG: 5'/3'-nucleotidase SurE [Clostridia bacterium]|nr:5'/3'-nucleotidase SurE [Clostridia bacterium]